MWATRILEVIRWNMVSGVGGWGCRGCRRTHKSFNLSKIRAKSENLGKGTSTLFNNIRNLYFLVIECINKSLLCHRKHNIKSTNCFW